jgi:hypothetical protein
VSIEPGEVQSIKSWQNQGAGISLPSKSTTYAVTLVFV